jgi:hypothetical protein
LRLIGIGQDDDDRKISGLRFYIRCYATLLIRIGDKHYVGSGLIALFSLRPHSFLAFIHVALHNLLASFLFCLFNAAVIHTRPHHISIMDCQHAGAKIAKCQGSLGYGIRTGMKKVTS